jgi:hypothetical protein
MCRAQARLVCRQLPVQLVRPEDRRPEALRRGRLRAVPGSASTLYGPGDRANLLVRQNVERRLEDLVDRLLRPRAHDLHGISRLLALSSNPEAPHRLCRLAPAEIHDRPHARLLREQAHEREAEAPLAQQLLRLALRRASIPYPVQAGGRGAHGLEPLERVARELVHERPAQRRPVVLPEEEEPVPERGALGCVERRLRAPSAAQWLGLVHRARTLRSGRTKLSKYQKTSSSSSSRRLRMSDGGACGRAPFAACLPFLLSSAGPGASHAQSDTRRPWRTPCKEGASKRRAVTKRFTSARHPSAPCTDDTRTTRAGAGARTVEHDRAVVRAAPQRARDDRVRDEDNVAPDLPVHSQPRRSRGAQRGLTSPALHANSAKRGFARARSGCEGAGASALASPGTSAHCVSGWIESSESISCSARVSHGCARTAERGARTKMTELSIGCAAFVCTWSARFDFGGGCCRARADVPWTDTQRPAAARTRTSRGTTASAPSARPRARAAAASGPLPAPRRSYRRRARRRPRAGRTRAGRRGARARARPRLAPWRPAPCMRRRRPGAPRARMPGEAGAARLRGGVSGARQKHKEGGAHGSAGARPSGCPCPARARAARRACVRARR